MDLFLPVMLLLEKVIAFLKQILVAGFFGTNEFTDAYQVSENIVSIVRGAFSNSIPVIFLASLVQKKTMKKDWRKFTAESMGFGMIIVFVITAFLCIGLVVLNFVQEKNVEKLDENTSILCKFILILMPTVFLGFISSMMGAQLEAEKVYWPVKSLSLLTSICVVAFVVLGFEKFGLISIFIGEISALILHIILLLILIQRKGVFVRPLPRLKAHDTVYVWKKSVPLIISSSVYSINSLIDKAIAIDIAAGSATVLQYARVLTLDLFPTIIVTAFSGVLVRDFSEMVVSKKNEELESLFELYLETLIGFLGVVAVVSIFNSENIISVAYQRGAFNQASVNLTNSAFLGYAFGVFLLPIREVSARVHYAFGDTKVPFVSSMIGIGVNIILSIVLSKVLGLLGISVATSISILLSGIINIVILRSKRDVQFLNIFGELPKIFAGFIGVFIINCIFKYFVLVNNKFINLIIISVGSLITYYLITGLLKSKATEFVFKKFRRRKTIL